MYPKPCCAFLSIILFASGHQQALNCRKCPQFHLWATAFPHVQPIVNKEHFLLLGVFHMQHLQQLLTVGIH